MKPLSETKRKLFETLQNGQTQLVKSELHLTRRSTREPGPLSPTQEKIWEFETKAYSVAPVYNESVTVRRFGSLDHESLERSLAEVIHRHEIWRTSYQMVNERPMQVVHPAFERFPLPCVDLRRVPEFKRETEILRLAQDQARQPFDLQSGPLLRAMLVRISEAEQRLLITGHQSVLDGVSVYQLFPSELAKIYHAFSEGLNPVLAELPLQFSDFASWQQDWLSAEIRAQQIGFWRERLSGNIPVLRWPADSVRPRQQSYRGNIRSFTMPPRVARAARMLGQKDRSTLFVVLLAAFYSLLYHYTDQTDLIVGTLSSAGRKRSEVQNLLGYFLNPIALRMDLSDDPTFAELLRRVLSVTSEAISNDDVPFEDVVEELNAPADPSRNPYFRVAISLQPSMPDLGEAWSVTSMDAESGGARLDLYLAFIERPEGLHARAQYNPELFEFTAMKQLMNDFQVLLENATARPQSRISELRPTQSGIWA